MKRLRNRQLTRNRVICFIFGVILLAVGILGLLLSTDSVTRISDWADRRQPLLNAELDRSIADNQLAFQLAALALALFCIVVGLLWLRSQTPPLRRQQNNVFASRAGEVEGENIVAGRALASAIEQDLEQHGGVERALVEMRPEDNLIRITVSAADVLSTSQLASTLIEPATERAVRVGELPGDLDVLTDVRLVAESRQVV